MARVDWDNSDDFDSVGFGEQFNRYRPEIDDETDDENPVPGGNDSWYLSSDNQPDDGDGVQVIHGSYYPTISDHSESTLGQGTDQSRHAETTASTERRERERLSRARTPRPGLPPKSTAGNGIGDRERWVDERNREAVKLAIQTLRVQRESDQPLGIVPSNPGDITESTIESSASIIQLPQPTWPGISFMGMLWRLGLTPNGEWVIQIKGRFEDRSEIRQLDEATGMLLKIRIDEA